MQRAFIILFSQGDCAARPELRIQTSFPTCFITPLLMFAALFL